MTRTALDRAAEAGLVATDVPLARLTTYKLGGPARWFADVTTRSSLQAVLEAWSETRPDILVMGRGSNLVVADAGFDGLVLRLAGGEFAEISHLPDRITAGGAVSLPVLARSAVAAGRLGLEFYVGIPGSVGGAIRQNAGCHGSETADFLIRAEIISMHGTATWRDSAGLDLSYRHSNVSEQEIVTRAEFSFVPGDVETGESTMREITRWRREHQPGGTFNAGSVFKNPHGDAAGHLIDAAGLKGFRVGGASVSDKHANFFVATPDASAADVHRLVAEVQRVVLERFGVELEPEIRFAGDFEA